MPIFHRGACDTGAGSRRGKRQRCRFSLHDMLRLELITNRMQDLCSQKPFSVWCSLSMAWRCSSAYPSLAWVWVSLKTGLQVCSPFTIKQNKPIMNYIGSLAALCGWLFFLGVLVYALIFMIKSSCKAEKEFNPATAALNVVVVFMAGHAAMLQSLYKVSGKLPGKIWFPGTKLPWTNWVGRLCYVLCFK